MSRSPYPAFGQELYMRETIEAARVLDRIGSDCSKTREIEAIMPHSSASTRRRVASKIVQRLRCGAGGAEYLPVFVRLLANLDDSEARRELVTYSACVADPLVGAIASDVLYPFFIENSLPAGAGPDEASPQREGLLLTVEPILTMRFLVLYARRWWHYQQVRCIRLAMRILHRGGIVLPQKLRGVGGKVSGYVLAPHGASLATFVWCLFAEARSCAQTGASPVSMPFVRRLVIPPAVVQVRMEQAEREGFIRPMARMRRRMLPACTLEEAVERLLAR